MKRSDAMVKKVTLMGLGSMGTGIAQNILKAGFDLTVYNRTVAKTEPLAKLGSKVSASPSEAAREFERMSPMRYAWQKNWTRH